MERTEFIRQLHNHGDAVINFLNGKGKKKYVVGTLDFTPTHIARKSRPRRGPEDGDDRVLIFSWDEDKFKFLKVDRVFAITPLSSILNNEVIDDSLPEKSVREA
jgi:hypothetical protein